jgi:hypothetical protein
MRVPASYSSVLVKVRCMYCAAEINQEPVENSEWQALFRFEQLSIAINGNT